MQSSSLPLHNLNNFPRPEQKFSLTATNIFLNWNKYSGKGSHHVRKTVKKVDNVHTGGGGGLPQFINFSLILPGPQITWKWTIHTDKLTTKCHICLHTCKKTTKWTYCIRKTGSNIVWNKTLELRHSTNDKIRCQNKS